jgi:Peptidase family M1 domain
MKLLCAVCVFCVFALPAFALDREAFTFTNYDLNVRVEPEQQRLAVRGKITLRNDSAKPQSNLALQISSSLDWRSIRANGKAVQFVTQEYVSDIDHTGSFSEAIVNLSHEIPPKDTIELEVGYEGVIALDTSRLTRIGVPEDKAKHTDWDQISKSFTAVRGIGYVTWYPIATEDASLTEGNSVEETIGRWQSKEANAEMLVSLQSTSGTPIGSGTVEHRSSISNKAGQFSMGGSGISVPTFVIADYQTLLPKGGADNVSIYFLSDQRDAAEAYAEVAAQIDPVGLGIQSSASLKILGLPDPGAQPFVTEGMLLTPLKSPMTNAAELGIVYAEARQRARSPRAWIQDGLAHFAQASLVETHRGRQAALDYLSSHEAPLVQAEKVVSRDRPNNKQETVQSLVNSIDNTFLQSKAMAVWWMLRDMVGEESFKSALLAYQASEDKEPTYLQKLMEKASQRDLQWFFDDWVYYDRGLPDFRVDSAFSSPEAGGFLVTITIENLGDAGAEVPLTLQMEGSAIRKRLEVRAKSKASIRIEAQSAPQQVTVNDGSVPESDTSNNTYKIQGLNH